MARRGVAYLSVLSYLSVVGSQVAAHHPISGEGISHLAVVKGFPTPADTDTDMGHGNIDELAVTQDTLWG